MNTQTDCHRNFAMPADFHRLGLKRGECSSMTIRDATQSAVHRLVESFSNQSLESIDRQLGQLATSAYRLLDPRYRLQFYERVQLSYAIDREETGMQLLHPDALLTVPEESIEFEFDIEKTFESDEREASDGKSIESAREVVRWIRHSEEASGAAQGKWHRHVLVSLKAWLLNRTS